MTNRHVNFKDLVTIRKEELSIQHDVLLERANESINEMIQKQIYLNMARNGLYSLRTILSMIQEGYDSYAIVEALKSFFYEMANINPEVAHLAKLAMQEHDEYLKETMEKIKPGI